MSFRIKLFSMLLPMALVSAGSIFAHGSSCSLASFVVSEAWAADSCTGWMKQNNGCSWRTCVDNRGKQYCQESCKGRINRVRCG